MPQVPSRVTAGTPTGPGPPGDPTRTSCRSVARQPTSQDRGETMGSLSGKVAVVTGGGSGIGLATATRLAEAGVSDAVVDLDGSSADPIYCLTKHAVVGLVRSLGPQLAEHHITINAVCPSIVDTPLIDDMREVLEGSGFPLIDVATVSEAVFDRLVGEETGEAMVIQAGREALPFRFARPPGPRVGGTVGQMPPEEFAAHDQG